MKISDRTRIWDVKRVTNLQFENDTPNPYLHEFCLDAMWLSFFPCLLYVRFKNSLH